MSFSLYFLLENENEYEYEYEYKFEFEIEIEKEKEKENINKVKQILATNDISWLLHIFWSLKLMKVNREREKKLIRPTNWVIELTN